MFLTKKRSIKKSIIREIPIIQIGLPNCVGNIYTNESIKSLFECFERKGTCLGELISDDGGEFYEKTSLSDVTHRVITLFIEDDFVVAVIEFLENQKAKDAIKLLDEGLVTLRPTIEGSVDLENKEIKIKELIGIDFLPSDERTVPREIKWIGISQSNNCNI